MKFRDLSADSCGRLILAAATVATMLLAGCSNSSGPAAAPSSDAQASTVFGDEMSLTGYGIQSKDGHREVELKWAALRKPVSGSAKALRE
jgi:hypothetical protein